MRQIQHAVKTLEQGGIIAYPTEAVFGLGCDPFNEIAVDNLKRLKFRSYNKGFIIIAADFEQLQALVAHIPPAALAQVKATWPGPITWVFPAAEIVPLWLQGTQSTIAVRVTDHPIASAICKAYGKPIVSTSANHEGGKPARKEKEVVEIFGDSIDLVVSGMVGDLTQPTEIRDALTGKILRQG